MRPVPFSFFCLFLLMTLTRATPSRAQNEAVPASPSAIGPQPPYPTAAIATTPGPFTLQSADGQSRLKVGGLIQSDLRAFEGGGRTGNSSFLLRRVRPILDGTLFDFVDFRLMPEFGEGRAALQDAYIDLRLRPALRVRSGKFKVPYSLERLQQAADVPFIERSIANNLIPNRDVGAMLVVGPGKAGLEAELGLFNGVVDNGTTDGNADNAFDVAARVFYQPFLTRTTSPLRGLGFGVAGTSGSAHESLSGSTLRTTGRSAFFHYADNTLGDGRRARLAPQFFYYIGSLGILGEHYTTWQRLRHAGISTNDVNTAFNLEATYVLTGERTSFRNVVPRRPFDPKTGKGGAYEIGLRYSQVHTDAETFALGLADRTASADKADSVTVGVNGYLNRQVKVQLNYERTDFGRTVAFASGTHRIENVILSRLQVNF